MCTTDPSLFHVRYSKYLNSDFNALCHLSAGMAFVEFKAEYLSLSHAFSGLEPISTTLIKTPVNVKPQELISNNVEQYKKNPPHNTLCNIAQILTSSPAFLCVCGNSSKGKLKGKKGVVSETKKLTWLKFFFSDEGSFGICIILQPTCCCRHVIDVLKPPKVQMYKRFSPSK
jgi:hypothetical protein